MLLCFLLSALECAGTCEVQGFRCDSMMAAMPRKLQEEGTRKRYLSAMLDSASFYCRAGEDCGYYDCRGIAFCGPGCEGREVGCVFCGAGKFKDTNAFGPCTDCPIDKPYTPAGATSMAQCTAPAAICNQGQEWNGSSCAQCAAGKYKDTASFTPCSDCPSMMPDSPAGATSIAQCAPSCEVPEQGVFCASSNAIAYRKLQEERTSRKLQSYFYCRAGQKCGAYSGECSGSAFCGAGCGSEGLGCAHCVPGKFNELRYSIEPCRACPPDMPNSPVGATSITQCAAPAAIIDRCAVGYYLNANSACAQCPPNRIGCGWDYDRLPAAVSILHARHASNVNIVPTSSAGIPDLSGTAGMAWKLQTGSISFETVDAIPCWNMNSGTVETGTRSLLGDSYTLFYHWKPRESNTNYRTLHYGTNVSTYVHACMT